MAVVQIPNLPPVLTLAGTAQFEIVQAGVSLRASALQIAQYVAEQYPAPGVTLINTTAPITGGVINSTGTIGLAAAGVTNTYLASMPGGTVKANLTGSPTEPTDVTPSALLDLFSNLQGSLLYRSAGGWTALAPGGDGNVLVTKGLSANPSWGIPTTMNVTATLPLITVGSDIQLTTVPATLGGTGNTTYVTGDLLYASSPTTLARLPGAAIGNVLLSGGVGAPPTYGKAAGAAIALGVGTTTVSSGTSKGILYNNAESLGNLATVNNGILITDGTGTPIMTATTDAIINTVSVGKGISTGGGSANGTDTLLGLEALSTPNTGYLNTGVGYRALKSLTGVTGGYTNVAIGALAMFSTTIGLENAAVGYRVLYSNIDGYQNSVLGSNAMYNNTGGYNNSAVGMYALFSNTGSISVPNGFSNSAFGFSALYGNTTGTRNTGIGSNAALNNTTGSFNTVIGMNALFDMTVGSTNTVVGYNTAAGILTGDGNTIIGANVTGLSSTLTNTVILANGAGAQRLFVDSAGLMGIGTSVPTAKLQLTGGDFYVSSGSIGIGINTLTGYSLRLGRNITGSTTSHGIFSGGSVQSDVTGAAYMIRTQPTLQAAAFTLAFLYHFAATQGTLGAGSSNSVQYGYFSDSSLIGATNNYGHYAENTAAVTSGKTAYGFYSNVNIASGGGTAWGYYAGGTAPNRFNSDLLIYGGTAIPPGGTTGSGYKFSSTTNFGIFFNSGAPTLSAARGSLTLRSDGVPSYNTNGTTGWEELTTLSTSQTLTNKTLGAPTISGAIAIPSGVNQRAGSTTLVGGTVAVTNTSVTANTVVLLTRKTAGGTVGNMTYVISAGVGFTINSDNALDTSTVSYFLLEVP